MSAGSDGWLDRVYRLPNQTACTRDNLVNAGAKRDYCAQFGPLTLMHQWQLALCHYEEKLEVTIYTNQATARTYNGV